MWFPRIVCHRPNLGSRPHPATTRWGVIARALTKPATGKAPKGDKTRSSASAFHNLTNPSQDPEAHTFDIFTEARLVTQLGFVLLLPGMKPCAAGTIRTGPFWVSFHSASCPSWPAEMKVLSVRNCELSIQALCPLKTE